MKLKQRIENILSEHVDGGTFQFAKTVVAECYELRDKIMKAVNEDDEFITALKNELTSAENALRDAETEFENANESMKELIKERK